MNYDRALQALIEQALKEDFGDVGDVTSLATIPPDRVIRGNIIAKAAGVIAGF